MRGRVRLISNVKRFLRFPPALIALAGLIWVCRGPLHANATTVALALLLLVLGIATYWGLAEAIALSLFAMLAFNYFFLPPVGTFTVEDPQNWVALGAFLVTAFAASSLSSRAARRATEAMERRRELERLYELSRAILMEDTGDSMRASLGKAAAIFGLRQVVFLESATHRLLGDVRDSDEAERLLESVAASGEPVTGVGFAAIPVFFGAKIIGSLAIYGGNLTPEVRDSIGGLLAVNYERTQAMDRALAADAARRNELFRTSLLDGIAHDLKTPLSAIRTCITRLIELPPRTEEVRRELLSIIDQESLRLQRSITEAVQLSRVESGRLSIAWTELNAAETIYGAMAAARDEHQDRYELRVDPDLTIAADPQLFGQALKQVLENAWKYTPAGTPVEIEAREEAEGTVLSVSDHGPGLGPEELERVFKKFYRGRKNSGVVEGTGMGLAIAKGIIEAHGGKIRAENLARGGAKITITLPKRGLQ